MSTAYHLWYADGPHGPFTLSQLRSMWAAGQLTAENAFSEDGGQNWRFLSEITGDLEPIPAARIPAIVEPQVPKKDSGGVGVFMILVGILAVGGIAFLCLAGKTNTPITTASSVTTTPSIPVEINLALNNIESATTTGINREDYANLVIALKSATSTYGQNLSSDQSLKLNSIVANYDLALQLWALSYDNGDYGQCISIGDGFINPHYDLTSALNKLDIKPDDQSKLYYTKSVLSNIWEINGKKLKELQ